MLVTRNRCLRRAALLAAELLLACVPAAASPVEPLITSSLPSPSLTDAGSAAAAPLPEGHLLVLGFAGDIGFSGDGDVPSSEGAVKHGAVIPWARLVEAVAPLLTADVNFANLETVVARSGMLKPIDKQYNFRADPAAIRQAVAAGFSVLTAANNHVGDFGAEGILETLNSLTEARLYGLRAFAGIGIGSDRFRPGVFPLNGMRVGVAAIGLGFNHAGPDGPGQPLYASSQDFDRVLEELGNTKADLRILSAHYGKELASLPGERDETRFRRAVDSGTAQIVFGHHSHVPSGVELRNGGVIFYGLGNFMHAGTQDMRRYDACRDFGLYAKVYLWVTPGHRPVLRAVELVPVEGTHAVPAAMATSKAIFRIAVLNAMSEAVAGPDTTPVRFEPTATGSGLACLDGGLDHDDELAARCRAAGGPRRSSPLVDPALLAQCGVAPIRAAPVPVVAAQPPTPSARPSPRRPTASAAADKNKPKGLFRLRFFD